MRGTVEAVAKRHYFRDLDLLDGAGGPDWLWQIRRAGRARFAALGFPHHKQEAWRFTNVSPIVETPFRSYTPPPPDLGRDAQVTPFMLGADAACVLVFVDGFFSPRLSRLKGAPAGVRVGSIAEGLSATNGDAVFSGYLDRYIGEGSVFTALNAAFLRDGAYVYVPNEVVVERPIHVLFVSTGREDDRVAHPRCLLVAGRNSKAAIVESYVGLGAGQARYFNNVVEEVVLQEGAALRRFKVVEEGSQGYHLSTTKVSQGRDSAFTSFAITLDGAIVRNELEVALDGEGASCALNGLYVNGGDRLVDNALFVEHAAPRCTSRIAYRGVLDGNSRSVFTGRVLVRPGAQKTDSNQLNNTMVLSDSATIDTRPQLEIFADDVKCTHGATVGQPPENLLFYFRSRGIAESKARAMLTYGFASAIVKEIDVPSLRERLDRFVFREFDPEKQCNEPFSH